MNSRALTALLHAAALAFAPGCSLIDLSSLSAGTGGADGTTSASSTSSSSASTSGGACAGVSCGAHGHCEATTGVAACVCDPHFDVPDCAVCDAAYSGADCLACANGYQDKNDDGTCTPACAATTCSSHGVCNDSSGAPICDCAFGWSGADCSTACAPGMGGARCDFQLVYGLDIPPQPDWNAFADIPYDVDAASTIGAFSRVAYRLILDGEEVWVEMDAFTADATKLGVPVEWAWDVPIANAVVSSTAPNQPSITTPTSGSLEFWSDCYDPGPDGAYDVDDDWGGGAGCYGSMQVHVGGATVFGFNSWTNGGTVDIGLGTAKTGEPDWTFHGNAFDFTTRRLEVYAKP